MYGACALHACKSSARRRARGQPLNTHQLPTCNHPQLKKQHGGLQHILNRKPWTLWYAMPLAVCSLRCLRHNQRHATEGQNGGQPREFGVKCTLCGQRHTWQCHMHEISRCDQHFSHVVSSSFVRRHCRCRQRRWHNSFTDPTQPYIGCMFCTHRESTLKMVSIIEGGVNSEKG